MMRRDKNLFELLPKNQITMNSISGTVFLKTGRDQSLRRRHPWIFSGAIKRVTPTVATGETVQVLSPDGSYLATGSFSPKSQIRVRVWSFDSTEEIDTQFFRNRLAQSLQARHQIMAEDKYSALRLVNAESDGLPGLIVDRYADYLVCQFHSAGAEYWKTEIVQQLVDLMSVSGVYERSEGSGRTKEGLVPAKGTLWGEEPPERIEVREGPLRLLVDVRQGHKTGMYLDQRENRALAARFSEGADVLNCFAYTGGFSLQCLHGGAESVVNVETSSDALATLLRQAEMNGFDISAVENINADVFATLRTFRDARRSFDFIILDPPKFASSRHQVNRAARGYKDINLLAFKLIRPGGTLFTFSCSGHVHTALFQKITADAAVDAGREAQILRYLAQPPDHAVSLNFPESAYLKGLICRVW